MNFTYTHFKMKWKLTNKVCPSQIGYYKSGEWTPKLLYNLKFVAYLHDPSNNALGWSGLVRSDLFSDFETLWNSNYIANVFVL